MAGRSLKADAEALRVLAAAEEAGGHRDTAERLREIAGRMASHNELLVFAKRIAAGVKPWSLEDLRAVIERAEGR